MKVAGLVLGLGLSTSGFANGLRGGDKVQITKADSPHAGRCGIIRVFGPSVVRLVNGVPENIEVVGVLLPYATEVQFYLETELEKLTPVTKCRE